MLFVTDNQAQPQTRQKEKSNHGQKLIFSTALMLAPFEALHLSMARNTISIF